MTNLKLEVTIAVVLLSSIVYWYCFRIHVPKGLKLPPGPPRRFLIGNLKDIPSRNEWKTFHSWKKAYGDLVYLNILGKSLLLINSHELVSELFDARAAIYSNRYRSTMVCDLGGFDWSFSMRQPDEIWKQHRAILHRYLSKASMVQHQATLEKCSKTFMSLLFSSPTHFMDHSRHILGVMIMEVVYGLKIQSQNDPYVEDAEKALQVFGDVSKPGAYLVDSLPFLKYIPEWLPGAGFKRKGKELKSYFITARDKPFVAVKVAMKAGDASPSIVSTFLDECLCDNTQKMIDNSEEEAIKSIAATIYLAGIDTTEATVQVFLVAMVLYPDVQKKAQVELDRVIGPNSFPTFKDRSNLPYVNALCKEVLRWHPITPFGFPHMLKQDDIIGEYFVPKGTMVMGNTWSLTHSEAVYGPNVNSFDPERFLKKDSKDPDAAFGYGRRACPGRIMADNMLFILIVSTLYVFDITPNGTSLPNLDDFEPGLISRANSLLCNIKPRTPAMASFLQQLSDN